MTLTYLVDEIRTPFVINDIKRVAEKFDTVYLFSVKILESKDTLPKNVVVFEEFIDWKNYSPLKTVLGNLFSILEIYLNESWTLKKLLPFKKSIALLTSNIYKAECVMGKLNAECSMLNANPSTFYLPPSTYYSFWFYDCIYLAWLKKKGWIGKAVTRAHSGDLYEDHASIKNKILFRNFQLKYLDNIFPVSKMGQEYLAKKYLIGNKKIKTIYLGSEDRGKNLNINKEFIIVSCARFRHHKRIYKIAEMLLHIDFPITWIHFGFSNDDNKDPTFDEFNSKVALLKQKSNIEFRPYQSTPNEKILEFYSMNQVNLFISLSEVEGVPVSIMEAISFGIPVLSTDVGGCKEIVTEQTGVLIPLQTEMKDVAQIITDFKDSEKNTESFRKGVRQFWEENFDAEKNYQAFFELIGN